MPDFKITLTDTEACALAYATEQVNTQRARLTDSDGATLKALSPEEVLQERVSSDLASVLTNVDALLLSVLDNIRKLPPEALDEVRKTITSKATQERLDVLLKASAEKEK